MRLRRTPPVPVQLRRPRPAKVLHFNELCSAPCQKARRRALFLVWYRHGWARRPSPLLQPEADFPCSLPEEKHDADLGFYKYVRYIAIPSLTHRDPTDYYSNPWELTADLFGGAQRPGGTSYYVDGAVAEALQYFVNAYDAKDFLPKPRYESFPLQYLFPQQ